MPGPGGGSSGGGFHGGGSFGGGGGFHGGGPRGPRGPRMGGYWFFGPRFYYGGGCLGWFLGPIIALIVTGILMIAILISLVGTIGQKKIAYNEETFQNYADEQYQVAFGKESAYEDKMLIVVLTYENHSEYDCIAWVGDHLNRQIRNMMGDENTRFGRIVKSNINTADYSHSLGQNLADAVDDLNDAIQGLELSSSFSCNEVHVEGVPYIVNQTDLSISELLDASLTRFTEDTGIELVMVIEDAAEVFGYQTPTAGIIALVILLTISGILIYVIVRNRKAKKNGNNGNNNGGGTFNGNPRTDNDPYGNDNW